MSTAAQAVRSTLSKPVAVRGLRLPPPALLVLAAVGGCLLLVVAANRWGSPQDEHAYWLAGQRLLAGAPLYDPTATAVTPYAYWYPPPLAQVMAPISAVLSSTQFSWAWTGLLLACLLWLGRGRPLVALALVAFVPVAVELWFLNVHLVLAAIVALAILRWPWMFALGAIIKLAPGPGDRLPARPAQVARCDDRRGGKGWPSSSSVSSSIPGLGRLPGHDRGRGQATSRASSRSFT